jgi:selenocysteine lyase/cysteine desulfurase
MSLTHSASPIDAAPFCPPPAGPLLDVVGGNLEVPLLGGGSVRYANLDYAASAPALRSVAEAVAEATEYYASVHRGAGYASQVSTALYERTRPVVARFVNARPDDVVVITRNTTDALNLLASAVPSAVHGGSVVTLDLEHHANLLPWDRSGGHRCLPVSATFAQTLSRLDDELRREPAALVAITGCSNVTGEVLPVAEVVDLAHRHGARVVVDAAQWAPHRRIDLAGLGADYLAFSGHKLYAPYGAGVLVGRRDWLDEAPAYLAGGGAVRSVTAEGTTWAAAPQRHEAGTPNVLGAVALAAACEAVAALPAGVAEAHEAALTQRLLDGLATLDGVEVLTVWPDLSDRAGVVGFVVKGQDPARLAAILSAEYGIGVRDGKFCAHPLLARLGHGDGALRASLGVGSRAEDVDRLVGALERILLDGARHDYHQVDGRWVPLHDTRPLPALLTRGVNATTTLGPGGDTPCR